nr:hypothetical protein [Bdellovibrionales bacterium]
MKSLLIFLLLITSVQAEVLKQNTQGDFLIGRPTFKMSEILADYAKLSNSNLSVSSEFSDEEFTVQGLAEVKKEQIENYISILLSQSGNAVIRMPDSPNMQVISARDIRYTTVPVYKTLEAIPKNDNQAQFTYSLKHIDASELSRNLRPFMGRYGRVIDIRHANAIHIADTGNNLRKLAQIVLHLDTEEFKKSQAEIEEINEKHKQTVKQEKSFLDIITDNQ